MELKKTLLMPKGKFQMRANLAINEPVRLKNWEKMKLYELMLDSRAGQEEFYLHDGPPYANGDIHTGHALNKIIKDIINRYKVLKGYHVKYVPGWDTHGLPIENAVTKLGVDRKNIPVSEFRKACMKYAYKQVERQKKGFQRLGVVGDFDHPYITMVKEYEADEVTIFADMALKGYIYKGLKPVCWSPSSECALAEAEIEYHDVKATTIYVKMDVCKGNDIVSTDDSFVIWTTTPWTIPADTAVCLNPDMEYGLYSTNRGNLVFLKELKDKLVEELHLEKCDLVKSFKGKDVEYVQVRHPLYEDKTSLVICGDHVTSDAGTGCVHTAGGHGIDDYKVCLKYNIPPFCPVDEKGNMTKDAGPILQGMFYEDANTKVVELLNESGHLLAQKEIVHSYPHDWRTNKPTIFRATPQWFCSISKFKNEMLEEVKNVQYKPSWGQVRLQKMVEGREDWCISRQRAWGVPLPIIYNEDGSPIIEKEVFDHIIKLIRENGSNIWFEKEAKDLLPEGYKNEKSPNGKFTKEKDIMDVWFDSGSSWLASQISYNSKYPADLIFEGTDQYRGWYNSSLTLAVASGHKAPYKMILTHGFIVDQNGEKFSKSKGNGISPEQICSTYGADILRLWAASIDFTMAEIKLSNDLIKVVSEQYRKIRNTFKFMLANLYDNDEELFDLNKPFEYSNLDKLMLAKFDQLLAKIDKEYADYDLLGVTSLVENFLINDLSAFYLDLNKDILYCESKDSLQRKGVQHVINHICKSLAIVLSPIMPFTMDEVNDYLPNKVEKNIALAYYPEYSVDENKIKLYDTFLLIRQNVLKQLEISRNNKVIESNLQGEVTYITSNKDELDCIKYLGEDNIPTILMIAKFEAKEDSQNKVEVSKTAYEKCDRCWNYKKDIEVDENGNHICSRCKKVIDNE